TMKLEGVPLKAALALLLQQAELTYVIKDDVVVMTTRARARGRLVQKTYAVADLVGAKARKAPRSAAKSLVDCIKTTIEPRTWSDQGGPGTVDYFPKGSALVVNQTPDVQEQVAEFLAALRRLNAQDGG